ncbi:hypothetical protein ABK040_016715 [Willaertia magna]
MMFHITSGKKGYNFHKYKDRPLLFTMSIQEMKELLTTEQKLRRSDKIQEEYTIADSDSSQIQKITERVQQEAIEIVFGVKPNNEFYDKYLNALRNARVNYKDVEEVNQITDYFKYDISREGNLKKQDQVNLNHLKLVEMVNGGMTTSLQEKSFTQIMTERNKDNLPIVIIGGSYS